MNSRRPVNLNVRAHVSRRLLIILLLFALPAFARAEVAGANVDRSVAGTSAFPTSVDLVNVGKYPGLVKSGVGYFYDDVLEYRVWLHPERGAEKRNGNSDHFVAFAQYERALAFSRKAEGAEEPLVLIRQIKHMNEPWPGVFEVVEGERYAEWQVQWLEGSKRSPGAIEKFLAEHRK